MVSRNNIKQEYSLKRVLNTLVKKCRPMVACVIRTGSPEAKRSDYELIFYIQKDHTSSLIHLVIKNESRKHV